MTDPTVEDLLAQVAALTNTVQSLTQPKSERDVAVEAAADAIDRRDLHAFVQASRDVALFDAVGADEYEDVA